MKLRWDRIGHVLLASSVLLYAGLSENWLALTCVVLWMYWMHETFTKTDVLRTAMIALKSVTRAAIELKEHYEGKVDDDVSTKT